MIKGFILLYLGQQDDALLLRPLDLVRRDEVVGYPLDDQALVGRYEIRYTNP